MNESGPFVKSKAAFGHVRAKRASLEARESNQMLQPDVMTLQEAAAFLRCHPKTLRLMAAAGRIPAVRVGRLWRFSRRRLTEWVNSTIL